MLLSATMFGYNSTVKEAKKLGERLQRAINPNGSNTVNKPKPVAPGKPEEEEAAEELVPNETVEDVELNLAFYVKHLGTVEKEGDKEIYKKHPKCLLAIKNMILQIRHTELSPKMTVRRYLINTGIVCTDLYPVLMNNPRDDGLWRATIWLIDELTMPPSEISLRIPRDILEDNMDVRARLKEMDDRRQPCKKMFTDPEFFAHFRARLTEVLKKPSEERDKIDIGFLRHSLNFVSNILEMRGEVYGKQTDSPASLHDKVFRAINSSGFTGIILYMACAEKYSSFRVLDILHNLLRFHDPEALIKVKTTESCEADDRHSQQIYQRSLAAKMPDPLRSVSRHSTFGGTFVLKGAKAVNRENDMVLVKPLTNILDNKFELTSDKTPDSRSRKVFRIKEERHSYVPIISPELRNFCVMFLENAYNLFMVNLKNEIPHLMSVTEPEEYILRYLWAVRFFMALNRFNGEKNGEKVCVDFVSETVSVDTFRFIYEKMENYLDMMRLNKTETVKWSERVHATLKCYQEMLWTVSAMLSHEDATVRRSAKQLESNVFYSEEHRDMFFSLLKEFHEGKFSRQYLNDLVITVHIFVKLIETCLASKTQLFVRAKQRKRKAKNPTKSNKKNLQPALDHDGEEHGNDNNENDDEVMDDEEDDTENDQSKGREPREVAFHLNAYVKRFSVASHLEPFMILLKSYSSNTSLANHAVLKMFHRIAWDLKMPDQFFQMELFRIIYEINNGRLSVSDGRFIEEYREFMKYILTEFFEQLRRNHLVILGTLFSAGAVKTVDSEPAETAVS
ncbi:protein timeless homolog isoform X2 [Paramacrobiotus metropolitanus]|nr:protein timeless homolog isoform X2 [Paramacrobiotus metropolitanus]